MKKQVGVMLVQRLSKNSIELNFLTFYQAHKVTGSYEKQPLISEFLQKFNLLSTSLSGESAPDQSEIAIQWYNLWACWKFPGWSFFLYLKQNFYNWLIRKYAVCRGENQPLYCGSLRVNDDIYLQVTFSSFCREMRGVILSKLHHHQHRKWWNLLIDHSLRRTTPRWST